jgi:hypothetical protein
VIDDDTGARARASRQRAIEQLLDIFRGCGTTEDTTGNSPASKWLAFPAIAEHLDFRRRYTSRPTRPSAPSRTSMKRRAFELLPAA